MAARPPSYSGEAALSLVMAVVASSPGPLLLLDGDLKIVAASRSFCDAFEIDCATAPGRALASLGGGEWAVPRLESLLDATVAGGVKIEAYEMDLNRPGHDARHLVVHAQRLVYLDVENLRLLMAVSDVTDARADAKLKNDVFRQNLILLQEVRHRVANSLQIIASVLMQNARRTRSVETRGHLQDAHHRVMSIAALERQLLGSGGGEVELRAYFTNLCDSIAASMIGDHAQLSLVVTGAGGVVDARVSASLGLIVTELVINALKHAFPDHRHGTVTVHYEFHGPNWTLSVADDGVGMAKDAAPTRAGMGASIVGALARQLLATVEIAAADPGTRVTITHTQIALLDDAVEPGAGAAAAERPAAQGHRG